MSQDLTRPSSHEGTHPSARRVLIDSWAVVGCLVAATLLIMALMKVWPACQLLLGGVIVGFVCSPVTNWFEDHHVPRGLAALLALLLVLAAITGILLVLIPPFIEQTAELLRHVPSYLSQAQEAFGLFMSNHAVTSGSEIQTNLNAILGTLSDSFSKMATDMVTSMSGGAIVNLVGTVSDVFTFFLSLVMAYWFAKDYPRLVREFATIAGPSHKQGLTMLLAVTSRSMGGYMRGIVITSAVGGVLSFFGFVLIGHPYAGLMGIAVGVLHFVPVIGPWCAAGMAAALATFVSPMLALESILVSVIAQNVTDNVVSPLVMQSAVKVHPVLSLFAIILGNSIGGVLGMALAIPLSAAIKGVFVYYFETKTGRQLVSYEGALFKGTPFHDETGAAVPSFDALDDDKFFDHTRLVPRGENVKVEREERPEGTEDNIIDLIRKYNGQTVGSVPASAGDGPATETSSHGSEGEGGESRDVPSDPTE